MNIPRCVHCGGDHPSSSQKCDIFLFEKEVQTIRVSERLPYREARQRAQAKTIRPGLTFAKVVSDSKFSRKRPTRNNQQNVPTGNASGMKRSRSKDSLTEPPSKVQSTLSSSPSTGDQPAVAGPSASPEAAPPMVGASVSSEIDTSVVMAEVHITDTASSEAVVASGNHEHLSNTLNDSLDAEAEVFWSGNSLPDLGSDKVSSEVATSNSAVAPVVRASGKPPTPSGGSRTATQGSKKSAKSTDTPPPMKTVSTSSKANSSTQKVDKSGKKLTRNSPLAGQKRK